MRKEAEIITYCLLGTLIALDLLTVLHIKTEIYGKVYSVITFSCGIIILIQFGILMFSIQSQIKNIGAWKWFLSLLTKRNIPYIIGYLFFACYGKFVFNANWNNIPGITEIRDGKYLIVNHGEITKVLTKQEYYIDVDSERNLMISAFMLFASAVLLINRGLEKKKNINAK